MNVNQEDILQVVRELLYEIMELDPEELEINLASRFQDDLELESIEMIALGDALKSRYQTLLPEAEIDFAGWLTQLSIEQLMELQVEDLVAWLSSALQEG